MNRKIILLALLALVSIGSFSQIAYVEGVLTEDKTWVKDTTYVIYKDVTVPSGVRLTIEPGTVVKVRYARSLIIDGGVLKAVGIEGDSIKFFPHHTNPGQFWKWSGIIIQNTDGEDENHISYAQIEEAETGVLIEDSKNVIIQNSSMKYCQNMGANIFNSRFCFIVNCVIEDNYNGVEFYSGNLGITSDNLILNTIIRNENHNVFITRENGGTYQNNTMSNNLIANGNNGIWINNFGGSVNSENVISKNIIINNGSDVGYGLFLAHDSTIVTDNIFWNNNIAIFSEDKGHDCSILNNSFYNNRWAIAIGAGSEGNRIFNNTFSLNEMEVIGIKEFEGTRFKKNNLVNNYGSTDIIVNHTSFDVKIPENYWDTQSEEEIEKLIFDHNDNPDVGYVTYNPITSVIDTTNPVSPPYKPIKQLINNIVQVSWNANKESDLRGYNVYYGDFKNYSFDQYEEVINDTTNVLVGDISIYDIIAVTAIDSTEKSDFSQVVGHESPFAFAEIYPYAGNDSVICKYQEEVEITLSNIPFEFQSLYWTTSGDGFFNNHLILGPVYYPGEDDKLNGGAWLSMNVVTQSDTITDSFRLRIIEDPFAFAGNDTTIVADTGLKMAIAKAKNYKGVQWFTSGDGEFSNDTLLKSYYTPGELDIELGFVYLELIAYSECGTASDSMRISIEPHYSIEGRLWTTNKSPYEGVIIALLNGPDGARATMHQQTSTDGNFRFPKVMKGDYYIYALPDTSNSDNLAPGYYANKMRWQSAYLLPVDADVYDIDITLPSLDFELPDGDGSISGHMETPTSHQVEDIYCLPWFINSNNTYCRSGVPNITVLLFNSKQSKLLYFTLTDGNGDFYFDNLPYGEYIVDTEKAGYISTPSQIISLSPDHQSETGVILEISNNKIGIIVESLVTNKMIDVFPVPSSDEIYLPLTVSSPLTVSIYDIFGNKIIEIDSNISEGQNNLKIDIGSLPKGLYFGRVNSSDMSSKFRFIVR